MSADFTELFEANMRENVPGTKIVQIPRLKEAEDILFELAVEWKNRGGGICAIMAYPHEGGIALATPSSCAPQCVVPMIQALEALAQTYRAWAEDNGMVFP